MPGLAHFGHWAQPPPIWLEGRIAAEYARLLRDPVYQGKGVPLGRGKPVFLIAGFLAGDTSMQTLRDWLGRVGYAPELPGLYLNIRYSEIALKQLTVRLVDFYAWKGRKVVLIGHSRGGLLAKVLAHRHPEMVEQVITLGSPLGDPYDVNPVTMAAVRLAHVFNLLRYQRSSSLEGRFLRDLAAPCRVPTTSIYSRSDGIVHWEACLRADVRAVEVNSSHVGLGVNPEVYSALGWLLQASPNEVASARSGPGRPPKAGRPA